MKASPTRLLTSVSLLTIASCLPSLSSAQDDRGPQRSTSQTESARTAATAMDLTQGVYLASIDAERRSVGRYAGEKLLNTEGAELGTIKDFIVHPATNQARYMVVSSGGFLGGMGNSLRLVPMEVVRKGSRGNMFEVDILHAQWLQVPPVTDENYVADRFNLSTAHHQEMVNRFGAGGASRRASAPSSTASPQGEISGLIRATALRGKDILAGNQRVGEIDDILIDVERGTAAALLDSSGDFTGTTAKYIVPLNRFTFDTPQQDPIGTALTRDDFARARPSGVAMAESSASQPSRAVSERPLEPTGRIDPDTAASQATTTLAASAQAIRRAINDDPALVAEDVQVMPASGKIVLRGSVRSETARRNIENVARRTLPSGNIDNQIVVERP